METTYCFVPLVNPLPNSSKSFYPQPPRKASMRFRSMKLLCTANLDSGAVVDYDSSNVSVFPVEACETVGGESCAADMYPETKLPPEVKSESSGSTVQDVDREYLQYDQPKTVFRDEACDDLGGEFCVPESS